MIEGKPKEWSRADIGTLCNLINGRAFKSKEWGEAGLPIIRIQNLNNPLAKYNYFDGELNEKHRIENGDLLFAWSGTPGTSFGAHVWQGEVAALNQHIFKIEFDRKLIDKCFLQYAINQTLDVLISGAHGGVGLRHVTKGKFEAAEISFPPLAEQKVIANKLDTLLTQVDSTKARLERIPEIIKHFRQSVLAAAVSGQLTEEWRVLNCPQPASRLLEKIAQARSESLQKEIDAGNKESSKLLKKFQNHAPKLPEVQLPETWQWATFMTSMEKVVDCHNKTAPYTETGIPLIRTPDIRNGKISLKNTRHVSDETYKYWSRRCPPRKGDILFTREAPMGEAGIVPDHITLCMGQRMMLLRPQNSFVEAEYVLLNILSLSFQQRMTEKAVGTGVKHLRVSDVESLTYPLPPIEEQTEIVRRVDQLFAYADTVERQVNSAIERVNQLTQSILAKAFRGELTTQWRADNVDLISGDNSAEALLARIKAERAAQAPKKRPRKKATT